MPAVGTADPDRTEPEPMDREVAMGIALARLGPLGPPGRRENQSWPITEWLVSVRHRLHLLSPPR
jgi:hypothetical protein